MAEAPPPDDKVPPPTAASDKPPSAVPGEPIKGEAAASAAAGGQAPAPTPAAPAAPKPATAGAAPAAKAAAAAGSATAPKAAAHPPVAAPPSGPPDPPPPAGMEPPAFIASLQAAIPGSVSQISYFVGDWTIIVPVAQVAAVARHLRDAPDAAFDFCSDVTATDWPPRTEARFDVVYCLYSTRLRHRVRVKVKVGENQPIPSATAVWPAANWLEREVWDLFGVNFTGHPDRRRILMPEDWQGFPQRKDYPLEGPGELLMENPIDWLKLRQARDEADIE
jgi:NADH-quinone oxidoreductase subunit C